MNITKDLVITYLKVSSQSVLNDFTATKVALRSFLGLFSSFVPEEDTSWHKCISPNCMHLIEIGRAQVQERHPVWYIVWLVCGKNEWKMWLLYIPLHGAVCHVTL